MADARLRSEWLGKMRFDDLSDAAWRVFTSALMWSVGNGTDGEIPKRHLRYMHPSGTVADSVKVEIVKAGLWSEQGDVFVMVDWAGALGQSPAEQIEQYREGARERQRRSRERAKKRREAQDADPSGSGAQIESVTENVTENVTREVTPNVGIGTGIGTGNGYEEGTSLKHVDSTTGGVTSWPTVKPGERGVEHEGLTKDSKDSAREDVSSSSPSMSSSRNADITIAPAPPLEPVNETPPGDPGEGNPPALSDYRDDILEHVAWTDPGCCAHGVTVNAKCRSCGGRARKEPGPVADSSQPTKEKTRPMRHATRPSAARIEVTTRA